MKKLKRFLVGMTAALCSLSSVAATFVGDRNDFRDETIYFAMTTRFYDGDPTNNVCSWDKQDVQRAHNDPDWRGDFKGLMEKLDYIKALGFTAIWITPIVQNASGEDYHGYHAMDFSKVDLRYESRKEWGAERDVKFKDLIEAAHAKGMKIVLDIVLNHTGNFGEVTLNPLFTRDENIRNQASVPHSLHPNTDRLSSNYFDQDGNKQYQERFKFFKNPQYDTHNYYHHYGTGWNWDLPNRWWGQIAGDCVDLNTENNTVAEHLVKCYGEFIKLGVDGFRIDTTGHISRLTFNKQFIPQFIKLANENVAARKGGPFFMFGECCARFGSVIYRDQHNLSSHFYTWKSDESLLNQFNGSQAYWDTQVLNEGHDSPVGPMVLCESEKTFNKNSNNVFMVNGAWHEPDYSEYSGFSVIDFPMHYNFNSAGQAINIAKEGDKYYNDASYNVVYVDSHDYCPGPNDGTRFNGGTEQWAENLSLMFTFRGIPCIYYGSEVEFKAGKPIDVGGENNKTPRKDSGRAYFGEYIEGSVTADDFGVFSNAKGNMATTLNGDLAHHVRRLNLIRAAVPALRKGQYTFDGCQANGGYAFKRAYKDSYALVALNGGATFTNVPAGTFTDIITGETYSGGGTITVSAPTNKGQLRVLVKGWNGGIVGEDGKFIYKSTAQSKGGKVEFADKGASRYYTADDIVDNPKVTLSPAGKSFNTETINVTAELNDVAVSGWYQIGSGNKVNLTPGNTSSFTLGNGMNFGETVTVTWGAKGSSGTEFTGTEKYKKVDPNSAITIYVKAASAPNLYVWTGTNTELNGAWPGGKLNESDVADGATYYFKSFDAESINIVINNGGDSSKTSDITGITEDTAFEFDGSGGFKQIPVPNFGGSQDPTKPVVSANPAGGNFSESVTVSLSSSISGSTIYYTTDGSNPTTSSSTYGSPLTFSQTTTLKAFAVANNVQGDVKTFTYTKSTTPVPTGNGYTIYFDNSSANWGNVFCYVYGDGGFDDFIGGWPGKQMTKDSESGYHKYFIETDKDLTSANIIFSNGSGAQTGDNVKIVDKGIYNHQGFTGKIYESGVETIADGSDVRVFSANGVLYVVTPNAGYVHIHSLDGSSRVVYMEEGVNSIDYLPRGFYIVNRTKVIL